MAGEAVVHILPSGENGIRPVEDMSARFVANNICWEDTVVV